MQATVENRRPVLASPGVAQIAPKIVVLSLLITGILISTSSVAQEHDASGEGGHGHEYHKNLIAGFIGLTGEERRERALTFGIDYERRITELIGVGFGLERATGELEFTVLTIPIAFHLGPWKLMVGPGVEIQDLEKEHELIRAGIEYAFDMGGYELAPKFMVDFVDGDIVIIGGLSFAWGL